MSNCIFGIKDYVKIDLKKLLSFYCNNVYIVNAVKILMKYKQFQEWSYWIGVANDSREGLLVSQSVLNGEEASLDSIGGMETFLKSCEIGKNVQSSFEEMLKESEELRQRFVGIRNYQDVFEKISDEEVRDYLEYINRLQVGDKGSAERLRTFYSKMLKLSTESMYRCSQNI